MMDVPGIDKDREGVVGEREKGNTGGTHRSGRGRSKKVGG